MSSQVICFDYTHIWLLPLLGLLPNDGDSCQPFARCLGRRTFGIGWRLFAVVLLNLANSCRLSSTQLVDAIRRVARFGTFDQLDVNSHRLSGCVDGEGNKEGVDGCLYVNKLADVDLAVLEQIIKLGVGSLRSFGLAVSLRHHVLVVFAAGVLHQLRVWLGGDLECPWANRGAWVVNGHLRGSTGRPHHGRPRNLHSGSDGCDRRCRYWSHHRLILKDDLRYFEAAISSK
jgi:hypothetical protein